MPKISIFIYLTLAFLFLLLISRNPSKPSNRRHRRLKLRSTFNFSDHYHHHHQDPIVFDPLVADIERRREDKQWEKHYFEQAHPEIVNHADHHDSAPAHEAQPEWEDFLDAEDYLNDEEKFNVTNRFSYPFLLIMPSIHLDVILLLLICPHICIDWGGDMPSRGMWLRICLLSSFDFNKLNRIL